MKALGSDGPFQPKLEVKEGETRKYALPLIAALALPLAAALVGCGEKAATQDGEGDLNLHQMVATVDGAPFDGVGFFCDWDYATTAFIAEEAVQGSAITMVVPTPAGPTTIQFGVGNQYKSAMYMPNPDDPSGDYWTVNGGSGSITIIEFASDKAKGSFEFTALNTNGDAARVTDGRFCLQYEEEQEFQTVYRAGLSQCRVRPRLGLRNLDPGVFHPLVSCRMRKSSQNTTQGMVPNP